MQTFLPYESYEASAATLDSRRLNKQILEACQILGVLSEKYHYEIFDVERKVSSAWRNHPAVLMWRGYEISLISYTYACLREWLSRDRSHKLYNNILYLHTLTADHEVRPSWLGLDEFHRSHRSNLTRKDPVHYGKYWSEPADLPYYWPAPHTVRK